MFPRKYASFFFCTSFPMISSHQISCEECGTIVSKVCCRDKYPCMPQKYFLDLKFSWYQGVNSLFEVSGLEFLFTWIKDCEIYVKYIKYLRVSLYYCYYSDLIYRQNPLPLNDRYIERVFLILVIMYYETVPG